MDRSCKASATTPQFSKALTAMVKGEMQPKWYCATHTSRHPNVSPVSGLPIRRQHKSYLKKAGEYVPLKRVPRKGGANGKAA